MRPTIPPAAVFICLSLLAGRALAQTRVAPPAPAPAAPPARMPAGPQPVSAARIAAPAGAANTGASRAAAAVTEFAVEGEESSSALSMQLQDGFVLGLARSGIRVLDSVDVAKRLAEKPELQKCDTSPCLKTVGQVLDVRFVLRVKISVAGSNYKIAARVFSTEGTAPAALPVSAQSRFCDVCTVAEAREVMIRVADAIKPPLEPPPLPLPPPPPPPRATRVTPIVVLAASLAAVVAGSVWLAQTGDHGKGSPALAGGLMGAGVAVSVGALYVLFDRGKPTPAIALALRW